MNAYPPQADCQIKDLHHLTDVLQDPIPFGKFAKLLLRKTLGPRSVRAIKRSANDFLNWFARVRGKTTKPARPPLDSTTPDLMTGDQVRVRSKDQIEATLDHWRQLRGCTFAPEMVQYCNTTQSVLKPVKRFVDERDLRIRRAKGIVLLEGIICQGTSNLGCCDRSCLFFWREEWLEKVEG